VVAVFVDAGELQVAVEEQPDVAGAPTRRILGDHDLLVGRALGSDDRIAEKRLACRDLEVVGEPDPGAEEGEHRKGASDDRVSGATGQVVAKDHERQRQRAEHVDHADEHGASEQPDRGKQKERKGEPTEECPHIVEGEEVGDGFPGRSVADPIEQRGEQGKLGPDERTDEKGDENQRGHVEVKPSERRGQQKYRETPQQTERTLDGDEGGDRAVRPMFGEQRADAHGENEYAEHDRRLPDRIAHQVGTQGDQRQFVDQPARRDHEDHGGQAHERQPLRGAGRGGIGRVVVAGVRPFVVGVAVHRHFDRICRKGDGGWNG